MLLTIVFCYPIFRDLNNIGYWDWDHHLFNHQVPLISLKSYGQFPLWNPYYCGGHVLWENPQVRFFTPMFIFHLILGPVLAIKIEIILHYFIALCGMYLVSKKLLNINNFLLSIIPAFYFVFNTSISAHIKEGHTWILCFAYIPFVFYYFQNYIITAQKRYTLISSAFLALMLYEGGIYPVPLTSIFLFLYASVNTVCRRGWLYLSGLLQVVVFTFFFSSLKLIPVLDFLNDHPRITTDVERIPLGALYDMFLDRSQVYYHQAFDKQPWGWHDYTYYIGIALFIIFIVSVGYAFIKKKDRLDGLILFGVGGLFFMLLLGDMGDWSPYHYIHTLPIFKQLHVTGRYGIIITFIAALLVANLMKHIDKRLIEKIPKDSRNQIIATTVIGLVFIIVFFDLVFVSRHFFYHTFRIDPKRTFKIVEKYKTGNYKQVSDIIDKNNPEETFHFAAVLSNTGTISCRHRQLKIKTGSQPHTDLVIASDPDSRISDIIFTPNRISFTLDTTGTYIFLNQSYHKGWKISEDDIKVENIKNRVAAYLPAGKYDDIAFYFFPDSFVIGSVLFCGFIAFLILKAYIFNRKTSHIVKRFLRIVGE